VSESIILSPEDLGEGLKTVKSNNDIMYDNNSQGVFLKQSNSSVIKS
jgi:hypothetical protein